MSDWSFDKQALDRYITREDDVDDYDDDVEMKEVECYECGTLFDIPALIERPAYKCDVCAERDMLED